MAQDQTPKMQTEVIPVEEFIFRGLKQRLHEVFAAPVIFSNSSDEMQALRKLQESPQGVKYPFMFLSVSSFTRSTDAYRSTPLIRRGIDALVSKDNKIVQKVSLMPVDFACEIQYKDNDFVKVKEFAKRWLMSIQTGFLKFAIAYGNYNLPIHIVLDDSIPTPKKEGNAENIPEYTVTANLIVKGWMSEKQLRDQQAVMEIDIEAYFKDLCKQENTQTFPFAQDNE